MARSIRPLDRLGILKARQDCRVPSQKSPIAIICGPAATGGKFGGIASILSSETLDLEPYQNVFWGS